jgi:hypothetical protein
VPSNDAMGNQRPDNITLLPLFLAVAISMALASKLNVGSDARNTALEDISLVEENNYSSDDLGNLAFDSCSYHGTRGSTVLDTS